MGCGARTGQIFDLEVKIIQYGFMEPVEERRIFGGGSPKIPSPSSCCGPSRKRKRAQW